MAVRIIRVKSCRECPYAEVGVLADSCKLLNAVIREEDLNTVKEGCPLEKDSESV